MMLASHLNSGPDLWTILPTALAAAAAWVAIGYAARRDKRKANAADISVRLADGFLMVVNLGPADAEVEDVSLVATDRHLLKASQEWQADGEVPIGRLGPGGSYALPLPPRVPYSGTPRFEVKVVWRDRNTLKKRLGRKQQPPHDSTFALRHGGGGPDPHVVSALRSIELEHG